MLNIDGYLVYNKGVPEVHWGRGLFNKRPWVFDPTSHHTHTHTQNCGWAVDRLSTKQHRKHLKYNTEEYFLNLGGRKRFPEQNIIAFIVKENISKLNYNTPLEAKQQDRVGQDIYNTYNNQQTRSRIYKEVLQIKRKEENNPIGKWTRLNSLLMKDDTEMTNQHKNMLNFISNQEK